MPKPYPREFRVDVVAVDGSIVRFAVGLAVAVSGAMVGFAVGLAVGLAVAVSGAMVGLAVALSDVLVDDDGAVGFADMDIDPPGRGPSVVSRSGARGGCRGIERVIDQVSEHGHEILH